jgi:hypothetical protein
MVFSIGSDRRDDNVDADPEHNPDHVHSVTIVIVADPKYDDRNGEAPRR